MMQIQPPPLLTATAEQLLCETFNVPLKLIQGEDLGGSKRSQVYRFQVASTVQTLPTSVIVKQANVSQETLQGQVPNDEWLSCFFNDWASLEFLHKIGLQISPRVYTGDPLQRLMVMEDLGNGLIILLKKENCGSSNRTAL
ncbi:hypothetical protein [Tengunoibacter tsumagoiensis]|uniref:Aminoglycoside phosphotransferase domain-containing protein n=1 Tax=Tengunoibacter tsumagoiensis TaxID=2014871 RepID=A0A401ZWZ5_9CHLR|nr:hypothetical protein [Tengunoibacter tsumagoiensis]GCE11336.1 hypothetical protein KTT_11950 [Tengunoibacter tsumagoiensis]